MLFLFRIGLSFLVALVVQGRQKNSSCYFIYEEPNGSIASPNFPSNYPSSSNCMWLITQPEGCTITLQFFNFSLEQPLDVLKVSNLRDGMFEPLGSWSGSQLPPPVYSSNNKLLIMMDTDSTVEDAGFLARYTSDCPEDVHRPVAEKLSEAHMKAPEECNYILDDVTGTIKSPNFPVEYPHHTNCSWRIKAPQNCTVKLNFSHFSLEYRHDNLTIYDGYDNSSNSVKFSGWYLPDPFYSTGRHLYIELNADGDVQWSGFLATYVSVCPKNESGGTLSGECSHVLDNDTGIIKSPNFPLDYPDGVLCSWKITVYEGCRIKLKFLHFALESGYDGLIIYDGYNTSSSSVTLSGWHLPDAYQSTGSSLFIKMKTDEDIPKSGFLATYTSDCPGAEPSQPSKEPYDLFEEGKGNDNNWTIAGVNFLRKKPESPFFIPTHDAVVQWRCSHILTNYTGIIESPNFPLDYPNLMTCSWRIGLPPGCTVKLNISSFDLEYNHDTLTIYDGYDNSSSPVVLTGYNFPDPFYSTGQYLYIEMDTDREVQKSGFHATYTSNCLLEAIPNEKPKDVDASLNSLVKQLFTILSKIAMTFANMINA